MRPDMIFKGIEERKPKAKIFKTKKNFVLERKAAFPDLFFAASASPGGRDQVIQRRPRFKPDAMAPTTEPETNIELFRQGIALVAWIEPVDFLES